MEKSLFEVGEWSADDCILSLGCGAGWWEINQVIQNEAGELLLLDPNAHVLNRADIDETIVYFEKQFDQRLISPIQLLHADASSIPLGRESVDQIWLLNSLHEMDHPSAVLQEIDRVLKEDGSVVVEEILTGEIHTGCGKKLFRADELIALFESIDMKVMRRCKKDKEAEYLKFSREA
jgi:ubiquinone/menaquinone biosynthesis C-methylase UbiE